MANSLMIHPSDLPPMLSRTHPLGCSGTEDREAESLMSWLHRLAAANGFAGYSQMLRERQSLKSAFHDAPIGLQQQLARLQQLVDTPSGTLSKMHLNDFLDRLNKDDRRKPSSQWFMQKNSFGSVLPGYRHAICVLCVAGSPNIYWRKTWRLSFWTECPVHLVPMLQECSICSHPIHAHGDRIHGLTSCEKCDASFQGMASQWNSSEFPTPRYLYNVSQHFPEELPVNVTEMASWWQGLLRLAAMVCIPKNAGALMVAHKLIPPCFHRLLNTIANCTQIRFAHHPISARHKILCLVDWLLDFWPTRLINISEIACLDFEFRLSKNNPESQWFTQKTIRIDYQNIALLQ